MNFCCRICKQPLKLGQLSGNHFVILLRCDFHHSFDAISYLLCMFNLVVCMFGCQSHCQVIGWKDIWGLGG